MLVSTQLKKISQSESFFPGRGKKNRCVKPPPRIHIIWCVYIYSGLSFYDESGHMHNKHIENSTSKLIYPSVWTFPQVSTTNWFVPGELSVQTPFYADKNHQWTQLIMNPLVTFPNLAFLDVAPRTLVKNFTCGALVGNSSVKLTSSGWAYDTPVTQSRRWSGVGRSGWKNMSGYEKSRVLVLILISKYSK